MPKKTKLTTTLVIVESPAKCHKIQDYLGAGYKCIASYGHVRTIPSLANIDIARDFQPTYELFDEPIKRKQMAVLQTEINNASEVVLASDADREGEMIAYSILVLFNLPLSTKRITFNEITKPAIQHAIRHPKTIDMNMVYAQQARHILDMLVGFKVSPMLWKFVKRNKDHSLSAGRCQTPALKLVYENYQDIAQAVERSVYHTVGYFTNATLPFQLNASFDSKEDATEFLRKSADFDHLYSCSQPTLKRTMAPSPFTTSRLQQAASNDLRYSPKETMRVCQQLYEGGYITYMRTESSSYSAEFINSANAYIRQTYNDTYIKQEWSAEGGGDVAHEAIRPTSVSLQHLPEDLSTKEKKMYNLIWTNALESCMAEATSFVVTARIAAPDGHVYTHSAEHVEFPGWKIVSNRASQKNTDYSYLQSIQPHLRIRPKKICCTATMTGTKAHYTEARLVQLLEERGIGRPSTFSSLIDKIQERGYVSKQDIPGKSRVCEDVELEDGHLRVIAQTREFGKETRKLVIQPLGIIVMEWLEQHFSALFQYDYTRTMEASLDAIAKGDYVWSHLCRACNSEVDALIERLRHETKVGFDIDDHHALVIGKYGPVVKCVEDGDVSFKAVKKDLDVSKLKRGELTLVDIVEVPATHCLGRFEGHDVFLKDGKFGVYASWGEKTKALKELRGTPIHTIAFEDVLPLLEKGSNVVREINAHWSVRKGPKGDYLFFKKATMKKPLFYDIKGFCEDYTGCDIHVLTAWIRDTYNVSV